MDRSAQGLQEYYSFELHTTQQYYSSKLQHNRDTDTEHHNTTALKCNTTGTQTQDRPRC